MTDHSLDDRINQLDIDLARNMCQKFCDRVNVSDPDVRDELENDAYVLVNQHSSDVHDEIEDADRHQLIKLKNDIDGYLLERDKRKLQRQLANKAISDVAILRQYLNQTFDGLWQTYGLSVTEDEIFAIAENMPLVKRPNRVRTSDGLKLAVCVLDGRCEAVDRQLCEFYVVINDRHHPKTTPIVEVVNCVANLKRTIKADALPKTYQNMGMTEAILDKIDDLIKI